MIAYLVVIPLFAIGYLRIPHGFYAPYAKLERGGQNDAYDVGMVFQAAMKRRLATEPVFKDAVGVSWQWSSVLEPNVSHFQAVDPEHFSFDLLLPVGQVGNGLYQMAYWGTIAIHGPAVFYDVHDPNRIDHVEWHIDLTPNLTILGPDNYPTKPPFERAVTALRTVSLTESEFAIADRYAEGGHWRSARDKRRIREITLFQCRRNYNGWVW
jgi:hypothetical protein